MNSQPHSSSHIGSASPTAAHNDNFTPLSENEWKQRLTPEEYKVLRQGGTEAPFVGEYTDTTTVATYHCKACGLPLFSSAEKFSAHCGWPAFFSPLAKNNIIERQDRSHGMLRTEVLCARCKSHLGHVFEGEGYETPTDTRYCINSICLTLHPVEEK